jgi:uncharacterized membrane protein YdbT with pleckstrin-like domain
LFLALAGATGAAIGYSPWPLLTLIVAAAAVLIALTWVAAPFIVWWATSYVITTDRLIIRRGVFNRTGHDMPLVRLNDISFSHNLFQRMLGCGTLVVESGGEMGQIELVNLPKVEEVQRTLYQLSDTARTHEARQVTVVVDPDGPGGEPGTTHQTS